MLRNWRVCFENKWNPLIGIDFKLNAPIKMIKHKTGKIVKNAKVDSSEFTN